MAGTGKKVRCTECSRQSLLSTLNNFVEEVNTMNDKVMVPSRLRDMNFSDNMQNSEDNNNMSVMPSTGECQGDLYSYYSMINAIKTEILAGRGQNGQPKSLITERTSSTDSDVMETSSETSSTSSDTESDDGANDAARQTAEAFRHHLQGLFGLLNQLTNTAKVLGNTYEDQVGGTKKLRKFMI